MITPRLDRRMLLAISALLLLPLAAAAAAAAPATAPATRPAISPPGQVLVVVANLQECFQPADVADAADMQRFARRALAQAPYVPDVLLLSEVRRESAANVAQFLSEETGMTYAVAIDCGEQFNPAPDTVRDTAIVLNAATMKALGAGGFVRTPPAGKPPRNRPPRAKDHAHLQVEERDGGLKVASVAIHLAHSASNDQPAWADLLVREMSEKYPAADVTLLAGDFNSSRCKGLGNWKLERRDCEPKEFWTKITGAAGYTDAIFDRRPQEIDEAQQLGVARIDYAFVKGGVLDAASDLRYAGERDKDAIGFYSDHRLIWALVGNSQQQQARGGR